MPNKMVGAIFQKRELKILMTGENDVIDHVISIVLQKCIQGLKYSARLKVPKSKTKTKVRHFARLLLKIPCLIAPQKYGNNFSQSNLCCLKARFTSSIYSQLKFENFPT